MPRIWANVWLEGASEWRGQAFRAPWWRPFWPTHTVNARGEDQSYERWETLEGERLTGKVYSKLYEAAVRVENNMHKIQEDSVWNPLKTELPIAKVGRKGAK